jgi:drug/metabolite transporter (DMT)-like permease
MLWFVYSFLTAILNTVFSLLSRTLSIKSENPRAFSVIFSLFSALFSLIFLIVEPLYFKHLTFVIILLTILSSVCYAIQNRTQFYASKYLEASSLTIIRQLSPVIGFLAALVFLRENVTLLKLIAVSFILIGNVIAVYKNTSLRFNKGLFFALAGTFAIGIVFVVDKKASANYSLPVYSSMIYLLTGIYNYLLPKLSYRTLKIEFTKAKWKIALLALINVISYYFLLSAFRLAKASVVIPITASSTVLTVIAGMLILKERSRPYQKIVAVSFIFIGIILVNL